MSKIYCEPNIEIPAPTMTQFGMQKEQFWYRDTLEMGISFMEAAVYSTLYLDCTLGIEDSDVYLKRSTETYSSAEVEHYLNCIFSNIVIEFLQTGKEGS